MKINSVWATIKGRWSNATKSYDNITEELREKELTMEIERRENRSILHFRGGPTGFESYEINEHFLKGLLERNTFCICAGTTNSWPRCTVEMKPVVDFLKTEGFYAD